MSGRCPPIPSSIWSLRRRDMGLLGILLTFPVSGPILTAKAAISTVIGEAERQFYDEGAIREQLAAAEREFAVGAIDKEEFASCEEALLERLLEARRRRIDKAQSKGG